MPWTMPLHEMIKKIELIRHTTSYSKNSITYLMMSELFTCGIWALNSSVSPEIKFFFPRFIENPLHSNSSILYLFLLLGVEKFYIINELQQR